MKRILTILFLINLTICSFGQTHYKAGEKVEYLIQYGILTGGRVSLEMFNDTCCGGKNSLHTILTGYTTGLVDAIFKVYDVYECHIEPQTGLPLKSIRNISEGRYKRFNVVLFDREARPDSAVLNSDLTGIHVTEWDIHDILSCFYWLRESILPERIHGMKEEETITINTWFTDEYFPIVLRYKGIEEVKTKTGKIKCYKFNPVCEVGRLFKTPDDISFWFSADNNYLPVKIRFDIFVGAFEVDMVKYQGLAYPLEKKK